MLLSIIRFFNTWKRYGVAVDELSHLSDRELADIGITRGDIPRIAWEQSRYLAEPMTVSYRHSAPGFGRALPFWAARYRSRLHALGFDDRQRAGAGEKFHQRARRRLPSLAAAPTPAA